MSLNPANAYRRFYNGEYEAVVTALDEAIRLKPDDARFFYFRGLAHRRLGDTDAARADFEAGGHAELNGTDSDDIGWAVERIQGRERLVLEQYRP